MLNFYLDYFSYCYCIMASMSSQERLPKPALFFCKKCNSKHVKPVGAKCERQKRDQEKRDNSRERTRKRPRLKRTARTHRRRHLISC